VLAIAVPLLIAVPVLVAVPELVAVPLLARTSFGSKLYSGWLRVKRPPGVGPAGVMDLAINRDVS
jgi:hypothetical protein